MKKINIQKAIGAIEEYEAAVRCGKFNWDTEEHVDQRKWDAMIEYHSVLNNVRALLDDVQQKSQVRTIDADGIVTALRNVADKLGITEKAMNGITITVDLNAQDFPSGYKYTPYSTVFTAEFHNNAWYITDICRAETHKEKRAVIVEHTEESRAAILERFTQFTI